MKKIILLMIAATLPAVNASCGKDAQEGDNALSDEISTSVKIILTHPRQRIPRPG